MKKILLIQPRHNYAPSFSEKKLGHVYLPTSLLAAAAILQHLDIDIDLVDENISFADLNHNIVGVNLVGAPYIPIAIDIENRLKKKFNDNFILLIGGQVVSGLTEIDMKSLFSSQTLSGNLIKTISQIFNVTEEQIPRIENLSLINAYKLITDENLKLYLEKEFSFYLSQGCRFSCSFCAAKRTIPKRIRVFEEYRDINIALEDFEYIISKAKSFKIEKLHIYLSNLDLFQSPEKLLLFAEGICQLFKKYYPISIVLRGLSTSQSFLRVHKNYPHIIFKMKEAGLDRIGFGIDGATPRVYKETRKPQSVQDCIDAVRICREEYGITPETLMVFGHNNFEDEIALIAAVDFSKEMQSKYDTIPRPHVAKDIVPGNDGWIKPENEKIRQEFYIHTSLFQNLDFTAIPSPITHPNREFRNLVTKYYRMVCDLPNSLTKYVLPELPSMSIRELNKVRLHNREQYDI